MYAHIDRRCNGPNIITLRRPSLSKCRHQFSCGDVSIIIPSHLALFSNSSNDMATSHIATLACNGFSQIQRSILKQEINKIKIQLMWICTHLLCVPKSKTKSSDTKSNIVQHTTRHNQRI